MSQPSPVYIGQFDPVYHSDKVDLYIDIAADLVVGETISSVTFLVENAAGADQERAVDAEPTIGASRVDFRLNVPATPGNYTLTATFTISDGQVITKTASLRVV